MVKLKPITTSVASSAQTQREAHSTWVQPNTKAQCMAKTATKQASLSALQLTDRDTSADSLATTRATSLVNTAPSPTTARSAQTITARAMKTSQSTASAVSSATTQPVAQFQSLKTQNLSTTVKLVIATLKKHIKNSWAVSSALHWVTSPTTALCATLVTCLAMNTSVVQSAVLSTAQSVVNLPTA